MYKMHLPLLLMTPLHKVFKATDNGISCVATLPSTSEWLLAGMRAHMRLKLGGGGEGYIAAVPGTGIWPLASMRTHVALELV